MAKIGIGSWAGGHSTSTSGSGSGTTTTNNHDYAYVWQGYSGTGEIEVYRSHGNGTYNVKPVGGAEGFYIGEENLKALVRRLVAEELAAQGD